MYLSRKRARVAAGLALVALGVALASGLGVGADGAGAAPTVVAEPRGAERARVLDAVSMARSAARLPSIAARASATWCGTPSELDTRPNTVPGHPVHWIYATPSDGEDRFATFASLMQTDWETIDAWWRGQDPTRAPRSDLATFPCGDQLDISVLRLPQSGSQLAAPESPFELIWDALDAAGFRSQFTKYLVYYDGPVGNDRICGVGATLSGGTGLAVLETRSCAGVEAAQVVAHELLHALGAVPDAAPNNCPPPDDGHTCDDERDLMYPFTDGTPLSGLVLDTGRNDYYGHGGSWRDVQDSPWLVQLDRQAPFTLTISGPGRVGADVPGLDCVQTCTTTWNGGTRLLLTPTPNAGAKLVRWTGACTGVSQCPVVVGESSAAAAFFAPSTYRLRVRIAGRGSIRGPLAGIRCPGRCASAVSSYTSLRLTAQPAKGWRLRRWTGACRGTRASCVLPMTGNSSARAVFVRR
jgi:Divergent InlB B-repeat domain